MMPITNLDYQHLLHLGQRMCNIYLFIELAVRYAELRGACACTGLNFMTIYLLGR